MLETSQKEDMKWLRHNSDSYCNLKMQILISKHGMTGYGIFWVCCELVAQQGEGYRLTKDKNWKEALCSIAKVDILTLNTVLQELATNRLIDATALKQGDLFLPKMEEYVDETTRRKNREIRSDSVDTTAKSVGSAATNDTKRDDTKRDDTSIPFEKVWSLYPLKKSKKKASEKWNRLKPDVQEKIIKDIPLRKEDDSWKRGFVPHMITYLNQERWEDEIVTKSPQTNKVERKVDNFT